MFEGLAIWGLLSRFGKVAWGVLSKIPWWGYAGAAALIYHFAAVHHEHVVSLKEGKALGVRETEAIYQQMAIEDRRNQNRANEIAQKELDDARTLLVQEQLARNEDAARKEEEAKRRLEELTRRLSSNVTALLIARVPDVSLGYVMLRNADAAHANGHDLPAAPGSEDFARPSGVSLADVAELDQRQAEAFRQAVAWGTHWRDDDLSVRKYCQSVFDGLQAK